MNRCLSAEKETERSTPEVMCGLVCKGYRHHQPGDGLETCASGNCSVWLASSGRPVESSWGTPENSGCQVLTDEERKNRWSGEAGWWGFPAEEHVHSGTYLQRKENVEESYNSVPKINADRSVAQGLRWVTCQFDWTGERLDQKSRSLSGL